MMPDTHTIPSHVQARRDMVFLVLAGLFLGTLGMLNILGLTRFLALGHLGSWPIVVAIGALPYPVTFLCTDLISELWGVSWKKKSGKLIGLAWWLRRDPAKSLKNKARPELFDLTARFTQW